MKPQTELAALAAWILISLGLFTPGLMLLGDTPPAPISRCTADHEYRDLAVHLFASDLRPALGESCLEQDLPTATSQVPEA